MMKGTTAPTTISHPSEPMATGCSLFGARCSIYRATGHEQRAPNIGQRSTRSRHLPLLLLLPLFLFSCVGKKNINYLRDPALSDAAKLFENQKFEYRLQVNDVLSIRVLGLDEKTAVFFNIERTEGTVGMS